MSSATISKQSSKKTSNIDESKSKYRSKYDADFDDDENLLIYERCDVEEDYDDCKDIEDEMRKVAKTRSQTKALPKPLMEMNVPPSKETTYGKRSNNGEHRSFVEESPKKRTKMPDFKTPQEVVVKQKNRENMSETKPNAATNLAISNFRNRLSPYKQRSSSLTDVSKKSMASTPKSERKAQSRIKNLVDSVAYERNLSTSWADIIEEVEEQTKELNEYIDKVIAKYKLERDELIKNLECDTDLLRKRQKQINFGKITPEYQRYITELAKKDRKSYHPRTPNKYRKCSRRKFDGQVRKWRKLLHVWDENPDELANYKNSMETNEDDDDDFGCTSNITGSNISYIVDDYDIIDDDESIENK